MGVENREKAVSRTCDEPGYAKLRPSGTGDAAGGLPQLGVRGCPSGAPQLRRSICTWVISGMLDQDGRRPVLQKRLRRACGRALRARLIRSHNCAAVFGLRLCRNWALWGGDQKSYNLPLWARL